MQNFIVMPEKAPLLHHFLPLILAMKCGTQSIHPSSPRNRSKGSLGERLDFMLMVGLAGKMNRMILIYVYGYKPHG